MENRVVKTYAKISGKTIALRDVVKVKKSLDEASKDHNESLELKLALSLS